MRGNPDADRRERLIQALAAGLNHTQAAEAAGYSRPYVQRILRQDPSIMLEVQRRAHADPATNLVARLNEMGLGVLAEIAQDADVAPKVRVDAAAKLVAATAKAMIQPAPAQPNPDTEERREAPMSADEVAAALRVRA